MLGKNNDGPKSRTVSSAESDERRRAIANISCVLDALYLLGNRGHIPLGGLSIMASIALGTFTNKPWSVGMLARKYQIPVSTVSDHIARFIESGTVTETRDPDDHRKHIITMTPLGIDNAQKLFELLKEVPRKQKSNKY